MNRLFVEKFDKDNRLARMCLHQLIDKEIDTLLNLFGLITNSSTWKGPGQARYTDALFKQCRELYSAKLPAINLFEEQSIYSPSL